MKRPLIMHKTQLRRKSTIAGESIEEVLRRVIANKEPIPDDVPEYFTESKEGVVPETDIRTDRFDIAIQAADKFAASEIAKGEQFWDDKEQETQAQPDTQPEKNE